MAKLLALVMMFSAAACVQASGSDDDGTDPGGTHGGGGGDDDDGGGNPGGGHGQPMTGVIVDNFAGRLERWDLAAQTFTRVDIDVETGDLGTNGSVLVEPVEDSQGGANPDVVTVFFRTADSELAPAGQLGTLELPEIGFVTGAIQPSPDGSQFAMPAHLLPDLDTTVEIISVFDRNLKTRIQPTGFREPVWIDNDHLIAHDDTDLWILDLVAKTATRVGPAGLGRPGTTPSSMSLSPDHKTIAYAQDEEIWRIDLAGTNLVQLTARSLGQFSPTWSPDGSQLAVANGECPPLGSVSGLPALVVISSTTALQNADAAPVMTVGTKEVHGCGPYYWLAK